MPKKPLVSKPKQGAASRGLELVALIPGVPTEEEITALLAALEAAAAKPPAEPAPESSRP